MKTYKELSKLKTHKQRFEYLKLSQQVAEETFGFDRYLNQKFYKSPEWRRVRDEVIYRDNGCDLGLDDYPISGRPIIHHINPILPHDILNREECIMNPEYLICVSHDTHNAIHYGDYSLINKEVIERDYGDTKLW